VEEWHNLTCILWVQWGEHEPRSSACTWPPYKYSEDQRSQSLWCASARSISRGM